MVYMSATALCAGVVCVLAAAGLSGQQAVEQVIQQCRRAGMSTAAIGSCIGATDSMSYHNAAHSFCIHVGK